MEAGFVAKGRHRGKEYPRALTRREIELLHLVAEGLPNKEVARQLKLSVRTVEVHLRSIFVKLGVDNRTRAARFLIEGEMK